MSLKCRGISDGNTFKEKNWLPYHLRKPDMNILKNPQDIKDLSKLVDDKPLAGRFTGIGETLFKLGSKKASSLCTGPWIDAPLILENTTN